MIERHASRRFESPSLDDLGVLRAAVEAGTFVRAGAAELRDELCAASPPRTYDLAT
jgi:hypothetical protein